MTETDRFRAAFAACPLIAILRGVTPEEVEGIADALVEAGFRLIEVPLNSPDPFASIALLAKRFAGGDVLVGAGTVLDVASVGRVAEAGGTLVIAPNTDVAVIGEAAARGLVPIPGFATPSEGFAAIGAGAAALKLFPAEAFQPGVLRAMRAVLPPAMPVLPVGGITPGAMAAWRSAGAAGFGLGSALYRPGQDAGEVAANARGFIAALGAGA